LPIAVSLRSQPRRCLGDAAGVIDGVDHSRDPPGVDDHYQPLVEPPAFGSKRGQPERFGELQLPVAVQTMLKLALDDTMQPQPGSMRTDTANVNAFAVIAKRLMQHHILGAVIQ
jgi:hypothetical protein